MAIELNEQNAELIARRFKALSDPTRLRVLNELLGRDGYTVEIVRSAALTPSTG